MLWLGIRWRATGSRRDLALGALVTGLAFGNHLSAAFLVPATLFFVWRTARRAPPPPGVWTWTLALAMLGPLTYLYLPLRYTAAPALDWARANGVDLTTLDGFLWMVRARLFGPFMFPYGPFELLGEVFALGAHLWRSFLGVGILAAAFGLWVQARRDGTLAATLGLIALGHAAFFVNYDVEDKNTMFVPVFIVLAFWLAEALGAAADHLAAGDGRRPAAWLLASVTVLIVGWLTWSTFPRVDLHRYDEPRTFGERVLRDAPRDALIAGTWFNITPLLYLQAVEGLRRDVEIFDWGTHSLARQAALTAGGLSRRDARRLARESVRNRIEIEVATGRTVLALENDETLSGAFALEPRGDIFTLCAPEGCR
jgi:hypothetical protein